MSTFLSKNKFQKPSLLLLLIVSAFLVNGTKAEAIVEQKWYVNQLSSCQNENTICVNQSCVFDSQNGYESCTCSGFDYVPAVPNGWTLIPACDTAGGDSGTVNCTYQACAPTINQTYTENGAQASFGVSLDKATYAPGEQGTLSLIGATGEQGSNIGGWLFGGGTGSPGWVAGKIWCFLFGCSAPPAITVVATLPADAKFGHEIKTYCNPLEPPVICDDPITGITHLGDWWHYVNTTNTFSISNSGGSSGQMAFNAPTDPGHYAVILDGELQYTGGASTQLYFDVSGGTPTVNINFSLNKMFETIKKFFGQLNQDLHTS